MSLLATVCKEQELIPSLSYNFLQLAWLQDSFLGMELTSIIYDFTPRCFRHLQNACIFCRTRGGGIVGVETGFDIFRTPPDRNQFRHLPFLRGNYFPRHYFRDNIFLGHPFTFWRQLVHTRFSWFLYFFKNV